MLLISADFLASDYCFDVEMKTALERHAAGKALVIPVILRPVDWKATPFRGLQALPRNGKPVTTFENLDIAFEQVAAGIREAIEKLLDADKRKTAHSPEALPSPPELRATPEMRADDTDAIIRLLTLYIGPIASVLVRRAAQRCRSQAELCDAVAVEITNPRDRSRFLTEARMLNNQATGV